MTSTTPQRTLRAGEVLNDRFEVGEPIGAGAMGAVYRGHDRSADRPVAIKVLHPRLLTSREYVTRFKREALAASRFRHESAVRLLGSGETGEGLPFIAMELVEGRSLKEILVEDGAISIGRACNITQQLLRALGAAHQRGIVHRDMKPDNVRVVVDEDGIERPKILDFGIVKCIGGDPGDLEGAVKTKTGVVLGTPKYMAPEQVRGEAVDGRADIYAVGAMLYEMLCGEPPFVAEDVFGFVAMHLKQDVTPLTHRAPEKDVPPGLDELVLHMLEKDPANRPADASALADEIESWAVEDPRAAEKVGALHRAMGLVLGAGVLSAVVASFVTPTVGIPASAAAIGLATGAAIAARAVPRPSVVAYARRLVAVAVAIGVAGGVSLVLPGSPGGFVTAAHGLAALLSYAAYLTVWSAEARWVRFVAAGIVAPLVAALLIPARVVAAGAEPYFCSLLGGSVPGLQDLEGEARQAAMLAVVIVGMFFAAASLALPRPAAARV